MASKSMHISSQGRHRAVSVFSSWNALWTRDHPNIGGYQQPACLVRRRDHAKAKTCFSKCEGCGKLIHCAEDLEGVQAHLYDEHRFKLNPMRTCLL